MDKKAKVVDEVKAIAVFKGKQIRRVIHQDEWWFSVVDVVAALTESANPRDYWFKMKIREKDEAGVELSTICRQLKLESSDGKKYETDCANAEDGGAEKGGIRQKRGLRREVGRWNERR